MKLQQYYEVQTSLLMLQRRLEEITEEIRQAKYDLRNAEEAQLNYGGSVRAILDGFSGRKAEREELLHRNVRDMEGKRDALLREKEMLQQRQTENLELLKTFPSPEQLRKESDPLQWAALEAKYCAEALSPLLEENHRALLKYRSLLRGEYPILSPEDRQEISSRPNLRAKECLPWLHRLKEALDILGQPFAPGSYYDSPDAWLFGMAADHNRRDRLNSALDQVEAVEKILRRYR